MKSGKDDPALHLHAAACLFFLSSFSRAIEEAQAGPECGLKNRIMFHCAHRLGNEEMLAKYLVKLTGIAPHVFPLGYQHMTLPCSKIRWRTSWGWQRFTFYGATFRRRLKSTNDSYLSIANILPCKCT